MSAFDAGLQDSIKLAAQEGEEEARKRRRKRLMIGAGVVGGAAMAAGALIAARPGLRKQVSSYMGGIGKGGAHQVERAKGLPESAVMQAKEVAEHLRSQGIDPATARIAIAGTGGTGKSTLARGLAQEMGMKVQHLDDVGKSVKGRDLTSWLKKNPVKKGTIAEQTYLLNQVNPDNFDAIIRVHKPMEDIRRQILARGRGAAQLDFYDYDRLHETIRTAYETTAGASKNVTQNIAVKVKPKDGFKARQALMQRVKETGMTLPKGTAANREKLVFHATHGKSPLGSGIIPYVNKRNLAVGGTTVAAGAGVGAGAGAYGAHKMTE